MTHELMGELRSALAEPSAESWTKITELLAAWPDDAAMREEIVPYVERALVAWPHEVWREAPQSWSEIDAPLYRLTRPLALELVPLDVERWRGAVAATAELSDEPATDAPSSLAALLEDTYPGSMRANAIALAHYLKHALELEPTRWHITGGQISGMVHHGDLVVDGDFNFSRRGSDQIANLITGALEVSGTIWGAAFDGELMVGGDIRCGALVCDADLAFGGELRAKYVRLAWYDCAWAGGDVHADVCVEHGMMVGSGEINARLLLSCDDHNTRIEPEHIELMRDVLCDDILEALFSATPYEDEDEREDDDDEEWSDDEDDALSVIYERLDEVVLPALLSGDPVFCQ